MSDMTIAARDNNLDDVQRFVLQPIEEQNIILSPKDQMQLELAVEEIFVNIAHYSGSENAFISCSIEKVLGQELKNQEQKKWKLVISFTKYY